MDAGREVECLSFEDSQGPGVPRASRVTFSSDSRSFAIQVAQQGSVLIFDAATGKQRVVLQGDIGFRSAILFSPDGSRLVVLGHPFPPGSGSPGPTVWDLATGKPLFRLEAHGGAQYLRMAFCPDGKRIATADLRPGVITTINLWDAATGRELLSRKSDAMRGPQLPNLSFSPDGHRLVLQTPGGEGPSWDATPRPEE